MGTSKRITADDVRKFVETSMEPTKAQDVLKWLNAYVGKPITTRLADAANKAFPGEDFRIVRQYGMTHLENKTHRDLRYRSNHEDDQAREMYRKSISLLLAHSESAVPLDARYLTDHNTCYTTGTDSRNALRAKSLSGDYCAQMAQAYNDLMDAQAKIEDLQGYGKPFSPDRCTLEKRFLGGSK